MTNVIFDKIKIIINLLFNLEDNYFMLIFEFYQI